MWRTRKCIVIMRRRAEYSGREPWLPYVIAELYLSYRSLFNVTSFSKDRRTPGSRSLRTNRPCCALYKLAFASLADVGLLGLTRSTSHTVTTADHPGRITATALDLFKDDERSSLTGWNKSPPRCLYRRRRPTCPACAGERPLIVLGARRGHGRTRLYRDGLVDDCGLYILRGRQFNAPFSCTCLRRRCHRCYCPSWGPLLIRLSLATLRCQQGYVLATLATTAHEDQDEDNEDETDDHAGDGADDDAH